jgi:hypothetical protein
MEPPVLHKQVIQFEERNNFLHFMLGLMSVSSALTRHLMAELTFPTEPDESRDSNESRETTLTDLLI